MYRRVCFWLCFLCIVLVLPFRIDIVAQELTATRLHLKGPAWDGVTGALLYTDEVIPLVISNASPVAQPIRFLGGPLGSVRALEIGTDASTWIRGSLSVGELTGAATGEMVRIGTIKPQDGFGLVVDLTGTSTTTGILVRPVGLTGSDDAGIVISSVSNGAGTGIRIGGPTGSERPTLATGIEVTGGTGIRYNALYAMNGTGVDIGGSVAPLRGVDATAAGLDHIGVLGRGNTIGTGVMGLSQSSAYTDVPGAQNIGVLGLAATNSNASMDTLCGVKGITIRGGVGGTKTFSVAVLGQAVSNATTHSGYTIGVLGSGESAPNGQGFPYGGVFVSHIQGMSVVALGGDVFLGSAISHRPPQVPLSMFSQDGETTTHVFSTRTSGIPSYVNAMTIAIPTGTVLADMHVAEVPVARLVTGLNGADITGVDGGYDGRLLTIFNIGDRLGVHNEGADSAPANRILTPGGVVMNVPENGSITLWYDYLDQRWRVVSTNY